MKNILLITSGFPYGESEHSFLYQEFCKLCKCFHVSVLAIAPKTKEIKYSIPNNVQVYVMPRIKRNKIKMAWQYTHKLVRQEINQAVKECKSSKMRVMRLSRILSYSYYANEYLKYMQEIVIQDNIDCIYTYWCTQATLAAINIKNGKGLNGKENLKVITRFHGGDLYIERKSEKWQCYRGYIAQYADKLIFACENGKKYFQQHWRVGSEKLLVSILGSKDLGMFYPKHCDRLSVVSCSNLIPLKRVDLIVKGLSLLDDDVNINWIHIGSGIEKQNIENLCNELLKNKKNIEWSLKGYIENDQICQVYQSYEVQLFITTSSTEGGLPVSIQEALSMGIPVIGTDVGGIPEIVIDCENGFLLTTDPQPEEIAMKIQQFYNLSEKRKQKMKYNARTLWEKKCNGNNNAEKFVNLLVELI